MFKRLALFTCLGLVLSVASRTSAQLLVHYKLDETAGTVASDSSGKGNDGTLSGDPQWAAGWIGGALEFNGGDFITLPAGKMGLRSDAGTVAFWMNMSQITGGINTIFWGGDNITGGGFGPENEMHIHVEVPVANIWIGGEFGFYLRGDPNNVHLHSDPDKGDTPGVVPVNPILVDDGQWHHITGTWGNEDGNAKLYFDGHLLHEIAYDWTNISYPLTNIFLGKMANDSRTYTGLLDEVQIYGGALSADEIQTIIAGNEILNFKAALPKPAHQETDVPRDVVLSWMAGDRADKHNVYFGTNFDDVNEASLTNWQKALVLQNHDGTTYDPGLLEFNTTYYWRIDEVNAPPDSGITKGNMWSFTTANFIVVDDFESYTDNDPAGEAIWQSWIDGFGVAENGAQAGYVLPPYAEQAVIHGGAQSMPLFYNNDMKYSEAKRILGSPRDWTGDDVVNLSLWFRGNQPYVGSFSEAPTGTCTMTGSGTDIWGVSDEFHFAFKEVNTASKIIAQVVSLDNTNPFAKAGVMLRDTLDADSANVAVFITPENGVRFQYRNTAGGVTEREFAEGITAPQWVRLERTSGGLIRTYYSADGASWNRFSLMQVSMTMPVYIGLAVTSHDVNLTCQATFSNVSFPDTKVDPQWTDRDIGIMSNHAEPMYVAVSNSTGAPAAVYHENPNAAQIDTWTEWVIPLQAFADQGVNLTDVDSIAIGLGTKGDTTKPGGSGTIYFDDIRLYRPFPPTGIPVDNFSFELPGTEKQTGFDNVPGWNTDGPCADSGVETGYTPTDGDWTAYLMSGDPSVWQLTNYTVTEGDILELKVDARITWAAPAMQMSLYYDDGGTRVTVAASDVALTDAMQVYALSFSAGDDPAAVGHQIGVEFSNTSSGSTWIGLDNVRLEVTTD